jgi:hypothetical protein
MIQALAVLAKKTRRFQGLQVVMDRVSPGIQLPGDLRDAEGLPGIVAEELLDLSPEVVLALHDESNANRSLLTLVQICAWIVQSPPEFYEEQEIVPKLRGFRLRKERIIYGDFEEIQLTSSRAFIKGIKEAYLSSSLEPRLIGRCARIRGTPS